MNAAEPLKLAFSDKLGVAIFAYPDNNGRWCRAKLGISILARDDSPLLSQGIDGMLPRFGALFEEKCPVATSAAIAVYKAADRSLIGKSFTVAKADNWSRPPEGQASPVKDASGPAPIVSTPLPEAAPQRTSCDHTPVATPYFVAACIVRGLEFHRQNDGLDAARARLAEAGGALNCTPQSMSRVNDLAVQAALRIVNSGAISTLMDFGDGMRIECGKVVSDLLK